VANRWLLRIPSAEAEGRIFCFPYSGVGASMFSRWPRWIGPFEVCPIQLPGRENRVKEPHFGTFPELAQSLAEELPRFLDRPFAFFGHCAGALPAYETARRLAGHDLPSQRWLVVSAQVPPHSCPHDRLLDLSESELLAELKGLVETRRGEVHPAMLRHSLGVLLKDLDASRVYRTEELAAVRLGVTVLHWADDPEVTPAELEGWKHYAHDVRHAVVDGGHYAFLTAPDPLRDLLAALLREEPRCA
jgi:surfactin synthase thioesterase subunit